MAASPDTTPSISPDKPQDEALTQALARPYQHGFVTDIVEDELAFSMESLNLTEEAMRKRIEEVLDLLSLHPKSF